MNGRDCRHPTGEPHRISNRDVLGVRYHTKSDEVQRSVRRDKTEFFAALNRETEADADSNDFGPHTLR